MLGGFLLCHCLLTAPTMPSLGSFFGRRLVRLLPGMVLTTAMGLAMGDNWDEGYNFGQPMVSHHLNPPSRVRAPIPPKMVHLK